MDDAASMLGEQSPGEQERKDWPAFWATQGQPWRTEPEIDAQRHRQFEDDFSAS
jgi:hypothetical protein